MADFGGPFVFPVAVTHDACWTASLQSDVAALDHGDMPLVP